MTDPSMARRSDRALLASLPEPHSVSALPGDDPSRWPSNEAVADELRRLDPERYAGLVRLSYTPGIGGAASAAQVAEEMLKADRWLDNPRNAMASKLGGLAFRMRDFAMPLTNIRTMQPVELTKGEAAAHRLMNEAVDLIEQAAAMLSDSDEHRHGENAQRSSGEAMPARAEGIAQATVEDLTNE